MTQDPQPGRGLRAVFTVTVETRKGPAYLDHERFVSYAASRIEGALDDDDDIRDVTVVEAGCESPPGATTGQAAECASHLYRKSPVRVIAVVLDGAPMDCEDDETAHVWVRVLGWSPRRAFLTGARAFAEAAGCDPAALTGRIFLARLDLDRPPSNEDTAAERLEWPELTACPLTAPDDGTCGHHSSEGHLCTQPARHLGYHRNVRLDGDEWTSWVGEVPWGEERQPDVS